MMIGIQLIHIFQELIDGFRHSEPYTLTPTPQTRVIGIAGLPRLALKELTFAIYVNGTAWDEAKHPITEVFARGMMARQMTIDLPLGTHTLHLEFWRKGGSTGIKSIHHNVTVRRADRGMEGWELPKDVCMVSLMCRTLMEFDHVMRKEDNR